MVKERMDHTATKLMRQGRLPDCPGRVRLFHCPCLEGRSEPVHCSPVRKAGRSEYLRQGPGRSASGQAAEETGSKVRNRPQVDVPASTRRRPGHSGVPDAQRLPSCEGRVSSTLHFGRLISSQLAPLASPERAAVRTRNFRQCFEASDVKDASTVLRAEPTSW